jgi:hypothetical protein
MKIRTIDGKEGKIHSTNPFDNRILIEIGEGLAAYRQYYLGWQLTPIEPEKPKVLCRQLLWGCSMCSSGTAICRKDGYCVDQWLPDSYAERLQYAPGFEEPLPLYICDHAKVFI